jgi:hypothetical protein
VQDVVLDVYVEKNESLVRAASCKWVRVSYSTQVTLYIIHNATGNRMNMHGYSDYNGPGESIIPDCQLDDNVWTMGSWMEVRVRHEYIFF